MTRWLIQCPTTFKTHTYFASSCASNRLSKTSSPTSSVPDIFKPPFINLSCLIWLIYYYYFNDKYNEAHPADILQRQQAYYIC